MDKGPVSGQNYLLGKFNEYSKIRLIAILLLFCSVVGWKEGCAGSLTVRLGLHASLQLWIVLIWTFTK